MKLSSFVLSFVGIAVTHAAEDVDLSVIGENDLSPLNHEYTVQVDENCDYTMTTTFSHNRDFPMGTADTCLPGVDADDGKPILSGRYRWESFPNHVTAATGYDHLSLDWGACGHPTGGFLTPHYDLHYYMVTPEFRVLEMNCVVLPGTPACLDDAQDTPQGEAFFNVRKSNVTGQLVNMPPTFNYSVTDAVINMGLHAFDLGGAPDDPSRWTDPTYVEITYDAEIICVEPMLPMKYFDGDEDQFYEKDLEYVEQTVKTLPYYYSVEYDSANHVTTVIMKGASNLCQAEYQEAMDNAPEDSGSDSGNADTSGGAVVQQQRLVWAVSAFMTMFVGGILLV